MSSPIKNQSNYFLPQPKAALTLRDVHETKSQIWLLTLFLSFCHQASRAGSGGAEEQEAKGEAPPISVPWPDILGEPGRPAGYRQADRCNWEAGQGPPHLY